MRFIYITFIAFLLFPVSIFAQIPGTETIAAIVNGELILSGEIDLFMEQNKRQNIDFSSMDEAELKQVRSTALQRLIDNKIIIQGIEAQLSPTQKDSVLQSVERQAAEIIQRMQANYTTPAALAQREEEMGVSWEELRQIQYRNIYNDYLVRVAAPQLMRSRVTPPTEEEINHFKEDNPDFEENESIRAAHILFRVPEEATDLQENDARTKALEISTRAKNGENFENLAMTHSDDQNTKMQGGRIPPFKRGSFYPEFDVLFNLTEGDITDPIRSPVGFHVFKIIEKDTPISMLTREKMQNVLMEWTDELKASAKVEIKL